MGILCITLGMSCGEETIMGVNQDAMNKIEHMENILNMDTYPQFLKIGNYVSKTVDILTNAGEP
eukprot:scaffold284375_cov71-Attheya_sp.AAC.3